MTCWKMKLVFAAALALLVAPDVLADGMTDDPDAGATTVEIGQLNVPSGRINQRDLRELIGQIDEALSAAQERDSNALSLLQRYREESARESAEVQQSLDELASTLGALNRLQLELESEFDLTREALATLKSATNAALEQSAQSSASIRQDVGRLDGTVDSVGAAIDEVARRLTETAEVFDERSARIGERMQKLSESIESVRGSVDDRYYSIRTDVLQRTLIGLAALFVLLAAVFMVRRQLLSKQRSITSRFDESFAATQAEQNRLDHKLSEILAQKLTLVASEPADHAFPLTVAAEIHRMRKRIARLPSDTPGIKPLTQALERLERGLLEKEYEVVDLVGEKYVEGLNVKPRFIADDGLKPGEHVITNVISPQVNYQGLVLQIADVEVSVGD